jgi:hypothetical protein
MFNIYWTLGISALSLIVGLVAGYEFEASRYQAYKESVIVAQKVAESETKSKEIEAQNTTREISDAYQNDIAVIHRFYTNRLQHNPSRGHLPSISLSPTRTNENASDPGLAERCAKTTLMLDDLQLWIIDQGKTWTMPTAQK